MPRIRWTISIALIIILGFAVYSNSLKGEFIWDDELLIKDNIFIKSWSYMPKLFTKNIFEGLGIKTDCYRPLPMLTYMIDYSLWGLEVRGYHLVNIIIHILVSLVLYWFITILYNHRLLSLLTSLLFLVHPVHTEVVAYISGRLDSLAALFMLLCFIFYIKVLYEKRPIFYILAFLSYILALLSKENSLILPLLLLLYHYSFKKKIRPGPFISLFGLSFVYLVLRLTLLRSASFHPMSFKMALQRIPGFFVAVINYIRLLFLPFGLHMEYKDRLFSFADIKVILSGAVLLSLLTYVIRKRKNSLVFFPVFYFFIALLPVSNLYPIAFYLAEHYVYLPSIGFFLILSYGLSSIYRIKKLKILSICLIIGLLAFYSSLTISQNVYWREPISFYERTLRYAPYSPRMYNNLGNAYSNIGEKEKAIELYRRAIEINPNFAQAYYNLANILKEFGRIDEAMLLYKKAIENNPNYAEAYNNLGIIYAAMGKKEEAITLFKRAIEANSHLASPYRNLEIIER